MKPTETNAYHDILGIIERCQILGVSKLKMDGFEVEFFLERTQEYGNFVSHETIEEENNTPKAIDKQLLEEIRLSQLMIDDPMGFEREIIQQEQRNAAHEGVQN